MGTARLDNGSGPSRGSRRVLIAHNRYVSANPSGENEVVNRQFELLSDAGQTVELFAADSDDLANLGPLAKARFAAAPVVGSDRLGRLDELIVRFRPDVVHLHNPYPLISPRLVQVAHRHGVPIVQTVHNYRHRCMNGLLFRDGATCTSCEGRLGALPGLLRGCYRDSHLQSAVMGVTLTVHRRTWPKMDRFIAVSPFVAERMGSWGIGANQIRVVANPVPEAPPAPDHRGEGLLFVGRLSVEKGVDLLLDAWERSALHERHELVIAGSGPLEAHVRARASAIGGVRLLGQITPSEVSAWRHRTKAGVMSSVCFEALPSGAAESFAHARPVVTIGHGVAATVIDDTVGWVTPHSPDGLARGMQAALEGPADAVVARGAVALDRWHRSYRTDVVVEQLLDVYDEVIGTRR
jgi:glycosyltransferase involved in cell wall biosynthesis